MVTRKVAEFVEAWRGKAYFIIVLIIIVSSCTNTTQEESDLNKLHLSGNISSIKMSSYSIDYKFGEPVKGKPTLALNYNTPSLSRTSFSTL